MKKLIFTLTLVFATILRVAACPACERNQPKVLKGIVHGAGPDSNWDYVSIIIVSIITLFTLYFSIKWLIKPGEKNADHIKYIIIK